jgi:hypothetical protein
MIIWSFIVILFFHDLLESFVLFFAHVHLVERLRMSVILTLGLHNLFFTTTFQSWFVVRVVTILSIINLFNFITKFTINHYNTFCFPELFVFALLQECNGWKSLRFFTTYNNGTQFLLLDQSQEPSITKY